MDKRNAADFHVPVLLASASPRRRELLRVLGISFSVQVADVDEAPRPGEGPAALTRRLARAKALAVSRRTPGAGAAGRSSSLWRSSAESRSERSTGSTNTRATTPKGPVVVAADTVVVLDDIILGKPADDAEATSMLNALRGRAHRVLTGLALAIAGEIVWTSVVETRVWMRHYSLDEVERYVRSGSPLDKAGAYGIQDVDFRPVERIEGCYTNVVGLPLCEVRRALATVDPGRAWSPAGPDGLDPVPVAGDLPGGDACGLCERARTP